MALIKCPECGRMVSPNAEECPGCGAPVKELISQQQNQAEAEKNEITTEDTEKVHEEETYAPAIQEEPTKIPFLEPQAASNSVEPETQSSKSIIEEMDADKKKGIPTWGIVIIIVALLLLAGTVGGLFYYKNVYLPKKRDAEAPRYYVMAQNLNMRSTPEFEADYNKIASFPFGTELLIYDSVKNATKPYMHGKYAPMDARGKVMKDKCVEGYVSYNFMLPKADFFLLNSIFGNDDARTMLAEARYKRALLSYFKSEGFRGDIDAAKMSEYGIIGLSSAPRWQVFCRHEKAKSNNVYRSRKYRKDSKYTDLAVIIKNLETQERRLLYFVFDDDESFRLIHEQSAPCEGYMKDKTLKLETDDYGCYYVDVEYEY